MWQARRHQGSVDSSSQLPTSTNNPLHMVLDRVGVAALLGISARHFDDVRREDPSFPCPRMVGSLARWHRDVVLEWVRVASLSPVADTRGDERETEMTSPTLDPGLPGSGRSVSTLLAATPAPASSSPNGAASAARRGQASGDDGNPVASTRKGHARV